MHNIQTVNVGNIKPGEYFLLFESKGDNQSIAVLHRNSQDPNVVVYDAVVTTVNGRIMVSLAQNTEQDVSNCSIEVSKENEILSFHRLGESSVVELSDTSAEYYMRTELKDLLFEQREVTVEKLNSFGAFLFATHGGDVGYEWLESMRETLKDYEEVGSEDRRVG